MTVKPRSGIAGWNGWPDDVRENVRHWNKQGKLSFLQPRPLRLFGLRVFVCAWCKTPFRPQATVCVWRGDGVHWHWDYRKGDVIDKGETVCDFCVIDKARVENEQYETGAVV